MSQFMSRTSPPYWMDVKHSMRYFKGTSESKLYPKYKDIVLKGFCDADWVGDTKRLKIHDGIHDPYEYRRYFMKM